MENLIKNVNKQVQMHRNFFDRCCYAIENGYYLEAILMEYAAIEARLEALCGVLGLPCGKSCRCRKDIKISSRIDCLRSYRNNNTSVFQKTKLPQNFFSEKGILRKWIQKRDRIVHGLYKDELKYTERFQGSRELAQNGYEYCKLLYNETKRIRRLKASHPEQFEIVVALCNNQQCKGWKE